MKLANNKTVKNYHKALRAALRYAGKLGINPWVTVRCKENGIWVRMRVRLEINTRPEAAGLSLVGWKLRKLEEEDGAV